MLGFFAKKRTYLDYAGATPVLGSASRAAARAAHLYGNPGAIHSDGLAAREALSAARAAVARHLGCKAREIIFTSNATEANNLAIVGYVRQLMRDGRTPATIHCVTSMIEHPSVLACFDEIESLGCSVTRLAPDHRGIVGELLLRGALQKSTALVSIGWANSEIGTIQPIHALAQEIQTHKKAHDTSVVFHSDAGQAPLYLKTQVHGLGVDMLTLDSGKLYGPRGIGALYVSPHTHLAPVLFGGGQERGMRPGTEQVALAVGLADAYTHIAKEREAEAVRVRALRDECVRLIERAVPGVVVNTPLRHALPHIANISIPGEHSGEYITLALDAAGFSVSTKSACREAVSTDRQGEGSVSHVVSALVEQAPDGDSWRARNTVRISLGRFTHARDIRRVSAHLGRICRPRGG